MLHVLDENTTDEPHIAPRMEEFANSVTLKKIPQGPLEPTGDNLTQGLRYWNSVIQKTFYTTEIASFRR